MNINRNAKIAVLAGILIALLAGAYGAAHLMFRARQKALTPAERIDSIVSSNMAAQNLPAADVHKNYVAKRNETLAWEQIEIIAMVSGDRSLRDLTEALTEGLDRSRLDIVEESVDSHPALLERQVSIYLDDLLVYQLLLRQERPEPARAPGARPVPPQPSKIVGSAAVAPAVEKASSDHESPRVALIVDDVGYDLERALELLNLRHPMSISIFPKLKYTRHIAEAAHDLGYEVMMHQPMDSGTSLRRNPGFITGAMTEKEMYWVLERNFQSVPFVSGVNNHQGSKMTQNREAMERFMKYLAGKKMFFVDSRTTSESVAYAAARSAGLRAAENDMFLDNEKDVEYIKGRIELLIEEAQQNGKAIGICHVHPATISALREMFPIIEQRGVLLVFASDLAE